MNAQAHLLTGSLWGREKLPLGMELPHVWGQDTWVVVPALPLTCVALGQSLSSSGPQCVQLQHAGIGGIKTMGGLEGSRGIMCVCMVAVCACACPCPFP